MHIGQWLSHRILLRAVSSDRPSKDSIPQFNTGWKNVTNPTLDLADNPEPHTVIYM